MAEKLEKKKYNNNILFESKNITNNSNHFFSSENKNKYKNKFYPKLNSDSLNFKKQIYSVTESKNKFQEFKENIYYNDKTNNNIKDESRKNQKFIRLKKGIQMKKKAKTSRNDKINNKNEIATENKLKNLNIGKVLAQKIESRNSETLNHSYSLDNYLNSSLSLGLKYKSPFQNEHLFKNNFVENIKNEKRKTELIQAIEKYKKFKTLIPSKSAERSYSCGNLKIHLNEDDSQSEIVGKRLEQINRIKIQNIINFEKLYENIHKKNYDKYKEEYQKRKTQCDNEQNHKKIFVRQLLREEKYIMDEDGKEKILEINQSVISNKTNINKDQLNDRNIFENERKIQEIKEKIKNSNQKIIISDKNIIKANNEKNNLFHQRRRSFPNNNNIKTFINSNNNKNKIFIKKHPSRPIINSSSKLNNNKIMNKKIINRKQYSQYNFFKNNIKNHSYREIKSFSKENEKGKNKNILRYNKKTLNDNFSKTNTKKQNTLRNNNNFININQTMENSYSSNDKRINLENKKNIFHLNRSYDSKGNSKNNFIYQIINKNKQNNISPRQLILFNLNNQSNSEINKNNNFIIINASNNCK